MRRACYLILVAAALVMYSIGSYPVGNPCDEFSDAGSFVFRELLKKDIDTVSWEQLQSIAKKKNATFRKYAEVLHPFFGKSKDLIAVLRPQWEAFSNSNRLYPNHPAVTPYFFDDIDKWFKQNQDFFRKMQQLFADNPDLSVIECNMLSLKLSIVRTQQSGSLFIGMYNHTPGYFIEGKDSPVLYYTGCFVDVNGHTGAGDIMIRWCLEHDDLPRYDKEKTYRNDKVAQFYLTADGLMEINLEKQQ